MPNGTFQWSEEFAPLLKGLKERMGFLFKYPQGYTPEERGRK